MSLNAYGRLSAYRLTCLSPPRWETSIPVTTSSDTSASGTLNDSGIEVRAVYTRDDTPPDLDDRLAAPGAYPFTRGPYAGMYRVRPWTMRQYAGFATAHETNERFRFLLDSGQTGLSVAFDLPTQLGLDSDDPRAQGEVGRTGVAIDSLADMRALFAGIPLSDVSTSMTINAPAAILLLMYDIVAQEQGAAAGSIRGTIQNDILKEYVARGNYIFPPRQSMRLTTDTFAWCRQHAPRFNTISISGYHVREAGADAVQELGITLAHGIAYIEAAVAAGLPVDEFAPRLSFFFNAHNDVFMEVAKFRAARTLWAQIMRTRFGATLDRSMALRFHAQTGGSTLAAQQPLNNVVRVALQAFSAAAGGAQSIHTNGYDEALALPTEASARLALRTQQILLHESGVADTADPFAGSYYVESLTATLVERATELIARIDELGGAVAAVESGWTKEHIEATAWEWQQRCEQGERTIVGVNRFVSETADVQPDLQQVAPEVERAQIDALAAWKADRMPDAVERELQIVASTAAGDDNLLPPMRSALIAGCTVGELCDVLRSAWGEWDRVAGG